MIALCDLQENVLTRPRPEADISGAGFYQLGEAAGWRRERSATSNILRFEHTKTGDDLRIRSRVPTGRESGRTLWCQGAPYPDMLRGDPRCEAPGIMSTALPASRRSAARGRCGRLNESEDSLGSSLRSGQR